FNSGAMEHATNIAYPVSTISGGSLAAETLFAHELAHHWWGNTITCRTQEDMWLNEGWASYSESLFLEAVYGKERYNENIELNHRDVLQFAHIRDGESLPVSGIGHANTYGNHVYNKGADMVHTLRGMMGDDAFFKACKTFQSDFKFQDVSTQDMLETFQKETTTDLSGFFNQWIKKSGFPHFDIHWVQGQGGDYQVNIKQTPRFNEEVYSNVPITITAFSQDFTRFDAEVVVNKNQETFNITVPFEPEFWAFDYDDKISDATTTAVFITDEEGTLSLQQDGLIEVVVDSLSEGDSLLMRVEHHWAPADGTYGVPEGVVLSPQRFWNIDGIWREEANLGATINYSGIETTSSAAFGYLDNQLIRITEDSLVLLYRPNGISAWTVYSDYVVEMGSAFDKRGSINITNLSKGQYAFGMYDSQLASGKIHTKPHANFKIFPNPVDKELKVQFEEKHDCCVVEITNVYGQVVKRQKIKGKKIEHVVDVSDLTPGNYFVGIITENLGYNAMRFVVK
ncbi:MAG: T9SS type A sorting domain-containing protein, partial [Bacteroidia bacterium]|nr:T9SS type A sorting domain-containing protein [Bacteroidia bacterium]